MLYTTLPKLKEYLGIQPTDASQDAILTEMIMVCSEMLSLELWVDLSESEITKRYDGTWTRRIPLEKNISSIIEVKEKNRYWDSILNVDFFEDCILYTKEIMPKGMKNISIKYKRWYAEVPKEIEHFFLQYLKEYKNSYNQVANNDSKEIKTKTLDGLSITYFGPWELSTVNQDFKVSWDRIFKKYRNFNPIVI